jgi:pimeloyl-ACP methyl ester carboxylesterase
MADPSELRTRTVEANDLQFALLEAGSGPLALCLHGFPDCARTWQYLLPELARAGFHAVAPFMRGYAPTGVPVDGAYELGALIADAVSLHEVLGGDGDAVLIGHDWGAETAYGAAAYAPDRWRRVVTLAVPPAPLDPVLFSDYDQLKRFFYLFMFQQPGGMTEDVVAKDGMSFLDRLWLDWSPGYDASAHLTTVKRSLRHRANLTAALSYYRATSSTRYAEQQKAASQLPRQPTLYLHGARDGCISAELARAAESMLAPASRMVTVDQAGHFLHLEKPAEVDEHILAWVTT